MKHFVFLLFVILASSSHGKEIVPTNEQRSCISDTDCIVWDGTCCGCAVAGVRRQLGITMGVKNQFGINKKFVNKLKGQLQKECAGGGCGPGYSNEALSLCQNLKVSCINKLCELR